MGLADSEKNVVINFFEVAGLSGSQLVLRRACGVRNGTLKKRQAEI
eukprot:COSAG05_NODE_189_length_14633_cov_44.869134_1_plen_46_part_00